MDGLESRAKNGESGSITSQMSTVANFFGNYDAWVDEHELNEGSWASFMLTVVNAAGREVFSGYRESNSYV